MEKSVPTRRSERDCTSCADWAARTGLSSQNWSQKGLLFTLALTTSVLKGNELLFTPLCLLHFLHFLPSCGTLLEAEVHSLTTLNIISQPDCLSVPSSMPRINGERKGEKMDGCLSNALCFLFWRRLLLRERGSLVDGLKRRRENA